LDQSCLDGILSAQKSMIYSCQPFRRESPPGPAEPYRRALRYLVQWSNALENGAQVGAWATPTEPQIIVRPPMTIESFNIARPGDLTSNFTVADFTVGSSVDAQSLDGRAGTYVDLGFANGFIPADLDDTFERRLSFTFDQVTRFMLTFTKLADDTPGAKRILSPSEIDSSADWIDASGVDTRWASEDLEDLSASESGLGVVTDASQLTFLVSTPDGVFERIVPDATPLRTLDRNGSAAEMAVQDAASTWGLPDFVFSPLVERKGSGVREVGDGLIVVGDRGAIIQVKTREVEPRSSDREAAWIMKQIAAARDQVKGTARRVGSAATRMLNGRGRAISIDGAHIDWVGVIIIEHPSPPAIKTDPLDIGLPHVVLLRRDWEFLFRQLRSTYAVVEYLHRVAEPTDVLGEEPHRYFELAHADLLAEPRYSDPRLGTDKSLRSKPLLPTEPVGSEDLEAHGMVRQVLEDIATSPMSNAEQEYRQDVLASIDSLPVAHRTELGEFLLNGLTIARATLPGKFSWKSRIFLSEGKRDQLGFAVFSELTDFSKQIFKDWMLIRHDQRREFEDIETATSIGVLITPRSDGLRRWDTTVLALAGDPHITDEDRTRFERQWGSS
jgi:hypothetical protein